MTINSLTKRIYATVLSLVLISTSLSIGAYATNGLPRGDAEVMSEVAPLKEQFEEMLNNTTSSNEKQIILRKAYDIGFDIRELSGVTDAEIASARRASEENLYDNSSETFDRRVITRDINIMSSSVAGVDMPDYALWPKIYMQETNTYCSAATIYTVGKYIGANPPSQANIMSFWKSQWGVTYPDLPYMRNYLNNHLSGKKTTYVPYVVVKYAGNQTTFNKNLKNNVINHQPMILLIRSNSNTPGWHYKTNGHFCICNGIITWDNNLYFVGDPYYFPKYVSGAPADKGDYSVSWSVLNSVITARFGAGSQYCLT